MGTSLLARALVLLLCLSFVVPQVLAKPLDEKAIRAMFAQKMPAIFNAVAPAGRALNVGAIPFHSLAEPPIVAVQDIRSLRLLSPAHKAKEVVLVLSRTTRDEVHEFNTILNSMGKERPKIHIVPAKHKSLDGMRLQPKELAANFIINHLVRVDDPWMRDCTIPVALKGAGGRISLAVIDPLRGRGLGQVPWALGRRWSCPRLVPPNLEAEWGGDNGGNVLVTPDNIAVLGGNCSPPFRRFLAALGYGGRMVFVDTWWRFGSLGGGHVDEILTILPAPSTPSGYVIAVADPALGLRLLRKIKEEEILAELEGMLRSLFRLRPLYPSSFPKEEAVLGMKMVSEVGLLYSTLHGAKGPAFFDAMLSKELNERIDSVINMTIADLTTKLRELRPDLANIPIVRLPTLLRHEKDGRAGSMIPELVNSVHLGRDIILPCPLLRPFRRYAEKALAEVGLKSHFIPSATYHNQRGQLHCATVVRRSTDQFIHERYAK